MAFLKKRLKNTSFYMIQLKKELMSCENLA